MSTLTDQEIMRLMEGMDHNEDVMSKACSPSTPLSSLENEVANASAINQSSDSINGDSG
jgi:hypothetical protein